MCFFGLLKKPQLPFENIQQTILVSIAFQSHLWGSNLHFWVKKWAFLVWRCHKNPRNPVVNSTFLQELSLTQEFNVFPKTNKIAFINFFNAWLCHFFLKFVSFLISFKTIIFTGTSLSHSELNVNGPEIVIHSNSNKGPSYLRKSSKLSRSGYRFSQDYTQQNTSGTSKSVYFFESFFPKRANFESEL